jgi:hypothetical protein
MTCYCFCLLTTYPAYGDDIEVAFSNEFAELTYARDSGLIGLKEQKLAISLLVTEANSLVAQATLFSEVLKGKAPIELNIGGRFYLAGLTEPDDDIMALAFGARGRYKLPLDQFPVINRFPLYVSSSIFFAPEITTSGTDINITDIDYVRGEIELTSTINGFVGVRLLDIDRDPGKDDIVNELYAGARFNF